jgi:hypothetical protein
MELRFILHSVSLQIVPSDYGHRTVSFQNRLFLILAPFLVHLFSSAPNSSTPPIYTLLQITFLAYFNIRLFSMVQRLTYSKIHLAIVEEFPNTLL